MMHAGTFAKNMIRMAKAMSVFQRLGAVSKERSSGIGHFLSSHTIYLSTMLPFSCFLITVILGIMVRPVRGAARG